MASEKAQKTVVIGAGPVGALAALYAANRGDEVEVYELRGGEFERRFISPIVLKKISSAVYILLSCLYGV